MLKELEMELKQIVTKNFGSENVNTALRVCVCVCVCVCVYTFVLVSRIICGTRTKEAEEEGDAFLEIDDRLNVNRQI